MSDHIGIRAVYYAERGGAYWKLVAAFSNLTPDDVIDGLVESLQRTRKDEVHEAIYSVPRDVKMFIPRP